MASLSPILNAKTSAAWGNRIYQKPCVPIVAVPTTAGTAAEVTINYVITDVERKRRFVCVDPHDIPVIAVVDPEMITSMPKGLIASTGMDAHTHAIEGYTIKAAWEMTDMFHLEAIEIIFRSLRGAVEEYERRPRRYGVGTVYRRHGFLECWARGLPLPWRILWAQSHDTLARCRLRYDASDCTEYSAACTGEKYREIARAMELPMWMP